MEFDTSHLKGLSNFNQEQFKKNVACLEETLKDKEYPLVLDLHSNHNSGTTIGGFGVLTGDKLELDDTALVFPTRSYIEQREGKLWVYETPLVFPATCLSIAVNDIRGQGFYYSEHESEQEGYLLVGQLASIFFKTNHLLFLSKFANRDNLKEFAAFSESSPDPDPIYIHLLEALNVTPIEFNHRPELIRDEIRLLSLLDLAYENRRDYPLIKSRTKTGIPNFAERRGDYILRQIKTSLDRLISLNATKHDTTEHDTTVATSQKEEPIQVTRFLAYMCKKYKLKDFEDRLKTTMQAHDTALNPRDIEILTEQSKTGGSFLGRLDDLESISKTGGDIISGASTLEPLVSEPSTPALERIPEEELKDTNKT